jgi:hypothetical protein
MTEAESDMLRAVWTEAHGNADEWVALTELPATALALARNGYLQPRPAGRDTWRVALCPEGAETARSLFE